MLRHHTGNAPGCFRVWEIPSHVDGDGLQTVADVGVRIAIVVVVVAVVTVVVTVDARLVYC